MQPLLFGMIKTLYVQTAGYGFIVVGRAEVVVGRAEGFLASVSPAMGLKSSPGDCLLSQEGVLRPRGILPLQDTWPCPQKPQYGMRSTALALGALKPRGEV